MIGFEYKLQGFYSLALNDLDEIIDFITSHTDLDLSALISYDDEETLTYYDLLVSFVSGDKEVNDKGRYNFSIFYMDELQDE